VIRFLHRNLTPASRLGEIMFGLIMALGITGSVRIGREEIGNHELLVAVFGCNLAWAIVDGVMDVLTTLFERGRKARLVAQILAAPTEAAALARIAEALDDRLEPVLPSHERADLYRSVLAKLRDAKPLRPKLEPGDLASGLAVALIILLATLPGLVPLLLVRDTELAVRLSNLVGLAELFLLGAWWGKVVGASRWRIATGLTLLGILLVVITIALGG
jgi:VIT1/CCC1 family predicted Fe2+/Mn2+ transporter